MDLNRMSYRDDLLQLAIDLVHKNAGHPTQADLRRAVSTVYCAARLPELVYAMNFASLRQHK